MADQDIQNNVINHARADMARVPNASQLRPNEDYTGFFAWVDRNHSKQPSFGSQLAAMLREGIKDLRQTIMESYFGKPEHMPEAGTPLNPTQQQVTADQGNFRGYGHTGQATFGEAYGYADPPETISYTQRLEDARNSPGRDDDRGIRR